MTYDEVTLFTKFMQSKGSMNNFDYLYRAHRFDKRDLDTYLLEVDAEDVILSAFDFSGAGNTIFGFKYWKDLNEKWMAKLAEFRNTGVLSVEEQQLYCPHCGRLLPRSAFATKSNGQLHKHCRECEGGKWDKEKKEREKAAKEAEKQAKAMAQLEKEIAEKKAKLGKNTKVCGHCNKRKLRTEFYASDTSEDGLQEYCKTCQTELLAAAEEAQRRGEEQRRLEIEIAEREAEVQRMEAERKAAEEEANRKAEEERKAAAVVPAATVRPDRLAAPKLGEHDMTLHYKQGQKSLTVNAVLSAQIRELELTKCYLKTERTSKMFLIFNRVEGSNVTGASSMAQALLNVTSADIARQIAARFELTLGDNYYLHVTKNLAKRQDTLTVEIVQARSREEYARIAQRREDVAKGKLPPYEVMEDAKDHTDDGQAPATGESGGSPVPTSEPAPLLDFCDTPAVPSSDPVAFIDAIVKAGHVTERDLAAYLHQKGWELQEPVIVKKMKKFSL